MSNVENEVVSLTFDSKGFERGIADVLASLDDLTESINKSGQTDAFDELQDSANSLNFSRMEASIDTINSKLSVMGAAAFTAIQSITNSGIDAAVGLFQDTLGQILTGGRERSIAIEQAKFQFEGLGQDVEASMESAKAAVLGTAYGLDEAATIAASFGAAGIGAGKQLEEALRGVAGVASTASKPFAQIGTIFQDVAADGNLTGGALWRFQQQGIAMSQLLANHWGMTVQELEAAAASGAISFQAFAEATNEMFGAQAVKANETYTGSLANLRSAMNRIGEIIIAPKLEATRNVFNALVPVLDEVKDAIIPLTDLWKLFLNIQAIKTINFLDNINVNKFRKLVPTIGRIFQNLYSAIGSFLTPIKEAFREIFPKKSYAELQKIAGGIRRFTKSLALSEETASKVKRIFAGFFAILSIGMHVIKGIIGFIGDILGHLSGVGSGFLSASASVGDFWVLLKELLVDGKGIENFFNGLSEQIGKFIDAMKDSKIIQAFGDAIMWVKDGLSDLFGGATAAGGEAFGGTINRIGQRFETLKDILSGFGSFLSIVWGGLVDVVTAVFDFLVDAFDGLGGAIADAMGDGDFDTVLDIINTALFGGIVGLFYKFVKDGISVDLTGGVMDAVVESFEGLTEVLGAMQLQLQAGALMKIAKAVLILTISIVALSLIDSAALTRALGAMAAGFLELGTMMFLLTKIADPRTLGSIMALSGAMIAVGAAILLLSFATLIFSSMDWQDLLKGLGGLVVGLVGIAGVMYSLSKHTVPMIGAAAAIMGIGVAMLFLAISTKMFASLDWGELIRGLFGVAAGMVILVAGVGKIPQDLSGKGLKMLFLAISMMAIARAVKAMSDLDWGELARGLVGLGVALAGMVAVANQMQGKAMAGILALGVLAIGILILSKAFKEFAGLSWGDIARGLVAIGSLLVLVGALSFFGWPAIITMAALGLALLVLAPGLGLLASALEHFGGLSWGTIIGGVLKIAAALVILGLASVLLTPVVPFIALLGASLVIFGLGLALAGAGVYLFAKGLEVLGQAGGLDTLKDILRDLITLIPELATALGEALIDFVMAIASRGPELVGAIVDIGTSLLDGLIELAPKVGEAFVTLITQGLVAIRELAPEFIETGATLIIEFLRGIGENAGEICRAAKEAIQGLIGCLVEGGGLAGAGGRLLLSLTRGIREKIGSLIQTGTSIIKNFVSNLITNAKNAAKAGWEAVASFVRGVGNKIGQAVSAARRIGGDFITAMGNKLAQLVGKAADWIGDFVGGLASAAWQVIQEGSNLGRDIIEALSNAIAGAADAIKDAILETVGSAISWAKEILGLGGPSRVFCLIGQQAMEGLVTGISNQTGAVTTSATDLTNKLVSTFKTASDEINESLIDMEEFNPTITPVLDLTQVERSAKNIGQTLNADSVLAKVSYDQAQNLKQVDTETSFNSATQTQDKEPTQVIFEQTINAPEALTVGEIYRQTRSQISMAKRELELA